jgi:hypothetical protein
MVNDENATLEKLNCLCGTKHNIFSRVKMFKRRLFLQASTSGVGVKKIYEDKGKEDGINGSIMSKILPHFVKRKFSLTPMKKHLIIPNQLEYLESIVQLVREKKC